MCLGRVVSIGAVLVLIGAGTLAGVASTVAALASLVSYPVLLALGLPPVSANVTNTVALVFTGAGAAAGSRPELAGQGRLVARLGALTALGGGAGAALLLLTPAPAFAALTPRPGGERSWPLRGTLSAAAVYIGYFGAAGGIIILAVLSAMLDQPMARTNAVKNVLNGLANTAAAVAFALFGPVRWAAVAPLAAGFLAGGWIGPALVRRLPGQALRIAIGAGGIILAVRLGVVAYR
jgi:uncharacterized membrane protein YfcA